MRLDPARTLAWRLRRHALEPAVGTSVADVAERVLALRGWPFDLADQAICARQSQPERGALERALEAGHVIRSYAFRGGSYVFTHEIAALLARSPGLRHLGVGATGAGSDSLYKPLHWLGNICFGPMRSGQATFRLFAGDRRWPGLPDRDEIGLALCGRDQQLDVLLRGPGGESAEGALAKEEGASEMRAGAHDLAGRSIPTSLDLPAHGLLDLTADLGRPP